MANALVNLNYSCVSFKFFFEETHLLHKIMCVRIKKSWRVFPLVSTVLGGILTKPPFKRRDFSSATHRKGNAELTLALGPCSQAAWGHQVDSGGSSILGFLLGTGAEGKVNTLGSPEPLLGEPFYLGVGVECVWSQMVNTNEKQEKKALNLIGIGSVTLSKSLIPSSLSCTSF